MASRRMRRDASSLMLEAPFVMAMRIHEMQMAALTGTAQNRPELTRMVMEKVAATAESMIAANIALTRAMMGVFFVGTGTLAPASMAVAGEKVAAAVLKPYGQRVRKNARRLSRKTG
ncbi:hypothetical protein LXM94_13105 [Rhizobium sp. TRM95111]|uniref:hypothetical protein n=1 Tax=Rhizobium alarense TaxID=2846851 RepID=UPI001F18BF31|nr:hypothetical protein [Rhizobium alarense]MCF3640909.1 hypothetical protein [Rhizobium alarense]